MKIPGIFPPPRAEAGDKVILSGTIGDHGTTIMIARGELELETDIESDTAPVNVPVRDLIPVREEVKGACEILGLDPHYLANEGKLIAIVAPGIAGRLVNRMNKIAMTPGLHHL